MQEKLKPIVARKQMCLLFQMVLFFLAEATYAAPTMGTTQAFEQPDGTVVELRLFGDEYYIRAETLEGFTVVRDEQTGWISYAIYDERSGELISTGIPVSKETLSKETHRLSSTEPSIGEKHQAPPMSKIVQIVNSNHLLLNPNSTSMAVVDNSGGVLTAAPPNHTSRSSTGEVIGEIRSLTVVVDFSDAPAPFPLRDYIDYFNDLDWHEDGNSMSIRRYYREVSFGKIDLISHVYGVFRAPLTFAEYDAMPYSEGAKQILNVVLPQLDAYGFDFSQLTTDASGAIKAINFMYTGNPRGWAQGMWWHAGGGIDFSADGVHTGRYACGSANSPLEISTAIHEIGHMVGNWPDTYQYNGATESLGYFCIMGAPDKFFSIPLAMRSGGQTPSYFILLGRLSS